MARRHFETRIEASASGKRTRLAVFVHAFMGKPARMRALVDAYREIDPDGDAMLVDFHSRWYSNAKPEVVAARIARAIHETVAQHPYERIVLIGHSVGGVLVRKAYLFAAGRTEDSPSASETLTWAPLVERIITFAALDRGFTLGSNQLASGDSALKMIVRTFSFRFAQALGIGKFIRACRRGSPFIVNTRVQWIRQMQEASVPHVFQLIGDDDDLIGEADNVDKLLQSPRWHFASVTDANHANVIDIASNESARFEYTHALTAPLDDRALAGAGAGPAVKAVTYVVHGIRDRGVAWEQTMADEIQKQGGAAFKVVARSYGYFSALEFISRASRMRNVTWFMDLYTGQIAQHPHAVHDCIAHSNGTYLIGKAFERYATFKLRRVVLAGTVLPIAYDWDRFENRVEAVRNEVGSADIVVAVGPRLWERIADLLRYLRAPVPASLDLGGAGVLGFDNPTTVVNRYVGPPASEKLSPAARLWAGHGAALRPSNVVSIARFIVTGEHQHDPDTHFDQPLPLVETAAKFGWAAVLVSGVVLLGLAVLVARLASPQVLPLAAAHPWLAATIVVLVVLVVIMFALSF